MGLTGCEHTHRSADPHYRNRSFGRDPEVASQPRTQLPIRLTRTGLMVSHEDPLSKQRFIPSGGGTGTGSPDYPRQGVSGSGDAVRWQMRCRSNRRAR